MIDALRLRSGEAGLPNISTILASPNNPLLPCPADPSLLVNLWHHIENQAGYLALMKKTLKPGEQIVMIDSTSGTCR